ncbi:glucose dehydrogenase [FAD, quinone]-like [Bacillus rossius redtenbacheri]|uniref:glucose dehydrogenase [FAD, quinone]-like n=1 Tax=Bacillus rossius redtenbacheri TaxID=93214 RepID=UPI002FDEC2DF
MAARAPRVAGWLLAIAAWVGATRVSAAEDDGRYDFIVVGAGSAGCALASRLAETPGWNILLVEAGGEEPEWSRVPAYWRFAARAAGGVDWNYTTVPAPEACAGSGCVYPRGRCLGGSSSTNAMYYLRGGRRDYDQLAAMGNDGWGYEDVLPYFVRSERNGDPRLASTRYHGSAGPLSVQKFRYEDENAISLLQALEELGFARTDLNGERIVGSMAAQMTNRDGERQSANSAFLRTARKRSNLRVLTDSHVSRVLFRDGSEAHGIEYLRGGNAYRAFASKEVVISAGSIGSPQILQLSGIGPRDLLDQLGIEVIADLPVGSTLRDHPAVQPVVYRLRNTSKLPGIAELYDDFLEYVGSRQGPLTAAGTSEVVAFCPSETSTAGDEDPDLELVFESTYSDGNIANCYYDRITATPIVLQPRSRGYVRINTTDPLRPPLIQPNFLREEADVQVLLRGVNYLLELLDTPTLRRLGFEADTSPVRGCEHLAWGTEGYWRCTFRVTTFTAFHPVATCAMGPGSDPGAVVDPLLRVHGFANLRVVDASVLPLLIRGHTNAAAIMIGEKGADIIKNRWS